MTARAWFRAAAALALALGTATGPVSGARAALAPAPSAPGATVGSQGAAAAAAVGPAAAQPGTRIEALEAAVVDGVLSVRGRASFDDSPAVLGEDPSGDAPVPGIGADITTAALARPRGGEHLDFVLGIGDQPPPAVGPVPEAVLHWWQVSVIDPQRTSTFLLTGMRGGQAQEPGHTGDNLKLLACSGLECRLVARLVGSIGGGMVRWQVPAGLLRAAPGALVVTDGIETLPTTAGLFWGGARLDGGGATADAFVVPSAEVRFGVAAAGTPPAQVPLVTAATVDADGVFEGGLDLSDATEELVLAVRACYGVDRCATAAFDVTP